MGRVSDLHFRLRRPEGDPDYQTKTRALPTTQRIHGWGATSDPVSLPEGCWGRCARPGIRILLLFLSFSSCPIFLFTFNLMTMIYLGLDIGKLTHTWALVDAQGTTCATGAITTDERELTRFAYAMTEAHAELCVGCEATGRYYETVAIAFLRAGVTLRIVNPALTTTKALRRSMRSVKTDAADAVGIARRLGETRGEIGSPFTWQEAERALQALGRYLNTLKRARQRLQQAVTDYRERPLPHVGQFRAHFLDHEIIRVRDHLIHEAGRLYPGPMRLLVAIDGVGEESAARLLAEVMDLRRFPSSAALVAFTGMDPSVKESGTSVRGRGAMTKAGSPLLRHHLGWLAHTLVQWNPVFRERFLRAKEAGKPHGVAYGIVARKFVTVAYQCIASGTPFDASRVGLGHHAAQLST